MAVKKLYAVYDKDKFLGDYNSEEAAELLHIPRNWVSAYASSGCRALGRYTFKVVDTLDIEPLLPAWDRVRKKILTAGR